jgi:HAD superfamily hydrolase (TIGR01509 family)
LPSLIIFDFDGVLADSELLANAVLAEMITELGVPTTTDATLDATLGKQFHEVITAVEAIVGQALPDGFVESFRHRQWSRFRRELRLVAGARDYVDAFSSIPRCIASASSPDRIALCLDVLELNALFGSAVFSTHEVARGKPFPDIFLHAAARMGVDPRACIVIEDSIGGVTAGVAAGMKVIGLLAASHIREGHGARLAAAGAHHVARDFAEATRITRSLLAGAA